MSKHFFLMTAREPCKECGGPCGVELDVTPGGYSCGSTYDHAKDCKTLFCPHGYRWSEWGDCVECEREDEARAKQEREELEAEFAEQDAETSP